MNKKRKIIMWVGITVFILMGIFPPQWWAGRKVSYDFLLFTDPSDLALTHLTIQWIIVSVLTTGTIYSIKGSKEKNKKILDKEVNMTKKVESLPLRQSDGDKWEVENTPDNWIKCEKEEDARILSNAPIVLKESYETFLPDQIVAAKLDKTAEKMEQYNMSSGARYFRAMAEKARGKSP